MRQDLKVSAEVDVALDALIGSLYRIARGRLTWDAWLGQLLHAIGARDARIELTRGNDPAVVVAHASVQSESGLEFATSTMRDGQTSFSLIVRGSSGCEPLLEQLLPHMHRVLRLESSMEEEHDRIAQIATALAHGISVGLMLLRCREREVVYANPQVDTIAERSSVFSIRNERLHVSSPAARKSLFAAIDDVAEGRATHGRHVVVSGDPDLSFLCYRLDRYTLNYVDGNAHEFIVVLVGYNGELPALRAGYLKTAYGLTPKEARLALGLAHGLSLDALAEKFCVSRHTLRAQLKSVLRKTDVHTQAGLVRKLLSDPRLLFAPLFDGEEDSR